MKTTLTQHLRNGSRLWFVMAMLIAVFAFAESSRTAPSLGNHRADELAHILAHFLIFAALSFCLARALGARSLLAVLPAVLGTFLYGMSDELHQRFVPTRDASIEDLVVDCIGAAAGAGFAILIARVSPGASVPQRASEIEARDAL